MEVQDQCDIDNDGKEQFMKVWDHYDNGGDENSLWSSGTIMK